MYKRIVAIQIGIVLVIVAIAGAPFVWAGFETGDLVQVSGVSPFGTLDACGNFPGTIPGPGVVFTDSEVEPWMVVNPIDPDNIVAFWQQDRWSNGGCRGNVAGTSRDGGLTWDIVPVPGITDCTGGPWERASDPWLSFGPDGTLHQIVGGMMERPDRRRAPVGLIPAGSGKEGSNMFVAHHPRRKRPVETLGRGVSTNQVLRSARSVRWTN